MKNPTTFALTILVTAAVSGSAGWYLSSSDAGSETRRLREENGRARVTIQDLEMRVERLAARDRSAREAAGAADLAPGEAVMTAVDAAPSAEAAGPDREERLRRIAEIGAAADGWFAASDGAAALKALADLAALVPEGREPAMRLAIRINTDVSGAGELKLSEMVFYTNLGSPQMKALFSWSLENPSLTDFRVMAAYSLPWTQSAEATVAEFSKALRRETELSVQRALVSNLARMRNGEAEAALREVALDTGRDATLRAQVATELAMSEDPEVERELESLAQSDPDVKVREAAKAAMAMRDPAATGFMITGTLPKSQAEAAGIKPGDILVSYGGSETRNLEELRRAAGESASDEEVPVGLIRDGREVTLYLRPGQMGIFGRDVTAK